ncbi:MAG: LptE family protein [Acidobacteria bacterium]|nr:LptE family protein [Acidobacteriota bacterium]
MTARRVLVAILGLALSACGYALVGRGTSVDPSIKKIGVPLFRDTTGKPGLDQKVTQKVIEELLKRGRFDIVQEAAGVDALVEGQLVSYHANPVGFGGGGDESRTQASRYAITLTASVRYAKPGEEEPIWENESFSFRDEYDVGDDPAAFFDREDQAIERLATSFARSLVSAMLEAF